MHYLSVSSSLLSPRKLTTTSPCSPFERTLTLHKDSTGHLGFQYKDGKITAIVVNSSAARNGVLIDHNLLEVSISFPSTQPFKNYNSISHHTNGTFSLDYEKQVNPKSSALSAV